MGYPLPQDIKWICDKCIMPIDVISGKQPIFPDINKVECYHLECIPTLATNGENK